MDDMFKLKPMSKDAVPAALIKAERYRLLNEPGEAESICLDILEVDPDNEDGARDAAPRADRSVSPRLVCRRPPLAPTSWRRSLSERPTIERITQASSANGARRRFSSAIGSAPRPSRSNGCGTRWRATSAPRRSVRLTTMTRCFAGMPVRGLLMELPEPVPDLQEPEPLQLE